MRKLLRTAAFSMTALSLIAWLALGANRGWTKTSLTRWQKDPTTGLDGPVIEKRFLPGVELLGATWCGAAALFALSFCKRKAKNNRL